jgi:surface protein
MILHAIGFCIFQLSFRTHQRLMLTNPGVSECQPYAEEIPEICARHTDGEVAVFTVSTEFTLSSPPPPTPPPPPPPPTPITDANFKDAITKCLATNEVDGMCAESEFGAMPDWDVSKVTSMSNAFKNSNAFNIMTFNADLSHWNTASVTNMKSMFDNAKAFNKPLADWNTASVTTMKRMFAYTQAFNQPLADLDTSKVKDMRMMFELTHSFNQPLARWNTASVANMKYMF